MPEVNVRNCYINLLDGSKVSIQVKPSQLASELLSTIAIQLKLRDKEYFGLYYDVNGEYKYWLHPGRPVVEQVSGTYPDIITLHFGVIVYIENFRHLQDGMALNQYYNQCQQLIYEGTLHCQQQTLVKLAAIVLQIHLGDFTSEEKASKRGFECLRLFTRSLPAELLSDCEREALSQYSLLKGLPACEAISTYLELVQELPSYGMHFYEVKDKNNVQKLIGIGLNGITQFNSENRNRPELSFQWTEINKITSRDSKFLIEVRSQSEESHLERLQVDQNAISISPTLEYQSIVSVHSWYSDTPQLIRTMDSMAVTQLNFFEQRKKFRVGIHMHSSTSSSNNSVSSFCSLTHSSSACTQNSDCSVASMETTQAAKVASREHYVSLKNKKEELEQMIEEKEAELRRLVIEEAKLTGIVPDELTEEEKSTLPKQMATAYTLQHLVETIRKDQSEFSSTTEPPEEDKELKRLARAFEIQCSIVKAEYKIYKQNYTSKKIKKQRKKNYKNSEKKLKDLEAELEKRREVLGISTRHSRFYSQVNNKEEFTWSIQSTNSKSMTMPSKQKTKAGNNVIGKLSAVNENQVSKPHSIHAPRHSSAIPGRIDPAMIRNRQFKYNPTVFKKSTGSDSISTASPLDGSSFLSLYSKDSSHLSSCSLTSDDGDRCISCPATEPLAIKSNHKLANGIDRGQRVSQHLDLALPPQVKAEKGPKEPMQNLNLDMPAQVIFRPSTRYPKFPPTNSRQSPAEFYARSLPTEQISNSEANENSQSPSPNKKHFTSDQISKQHSDQKPSYTQHNPSQPHNTGPAASVPLSAGTHYPMPCLRVNSLPYGLYKSKSRSQELINYDPLQACRSSSPHYLTSPNFIHSPQVSNGGKEPYNYGGKLVLSNHNKPPIPITRIHTTPTNITTFEYSKPTHYPQAKPSSPREDRRNSRSPQVGERERRVKSQQYVVHNPWYPQLQQPAVLSPAQTRYIPPNSRLSGSTIHDQSRMHPDQYTRCRSPYNHIPVPPLNLAHNSRPSQQKPYMDPNSLYPLMHLKHDALTYTHSLPLSPQSVDLPPSVKSKINYWENHNVHRHIPLTQSMQQMEAGDIPPGIDQNMQSLNLRSAPVSSTYRRLISSDGFQYPMVVEKREFAELLTSPEEGTPV